jgi:7,8-didemethyl-8-hydroxy-5-deazariboflavin synthase CofH subunit
VASSINRVLRRAGRGQRISNPDALLLADCCDLSTLKSAASQLRDSGYGNVISYSPKVFIPLTQLCRDVCHYCTFAQTPRKLDQPYLLPDQVLEIARRGKEAGCHEALFTLGDKPELRYSAARNALADMGYASTIEYLAAMAELVWRETGLLPHLNPGVMTADELRRDLCGDRVSYAVNRNINYTNICYYRCQFCAFSKGRSNDSLRGKGYDLPVEEVQQRCLEAWERGATEVCLQGGIHPSYTGQTYLDITRAIKSVLPDIHIHAFSALEVFQGAETLGISTREFLQQLRAAGLGSMPGTAAEILDDEVRRRLCADKVNTQQWLDVIACAHSVGLKTTATIMFGHIERPVHWSRHLLRLKELQRRTGGFTEFVPLPYVHMEAPLFRKGGSRKGPTFREAVLMHAVPRLVLNRDIPNIQASWVKMGVDGVGVCLDAGVNDLGGTLMNESISRAAGAAHGQELTPAAMSQLIRSKGRTPWQRTTLYKDAPSQGSLLETVNL